MQSHKKMSGTALQRFCTWACFGGVMAGIAALCGCSTTVTRDFYPHQTAKGTILFTGRVDDGGPKIDWVHAYQVIDGKERDISNMGLSFGPYLLPGNVREFSFTAVPGRTTFYVKVNADNSGLRFARYEPESGTRYAVWDRKGIPIDVDVYAGMITRVTLVLHDRIGMGTWSENHFLVETTDPSTGKMTTRRVVADEHGATHLEDVTP